MKINVQFLDKTQTKLVSVFGSHQDDIEYPNQGEIDDTDQRYIDFITPKPEIKTNDFSNAVKTTLGGIVASNNLAISYPLFFPMIDSKYWDDAKELLDDAKLKSVITTKQYNDIIALASQFNIPFTAI